MNRLSYLLTRFGLVILFLTPLETHAEEQESHRASRLGNPATRFAPTIVTVDDLRSRFSDPQLRLDMASILRQWGWKGNLDDLFNAAATADVIEWKIATGETMPYMSSREQGDPICLRNVLWVGKEPISAYAFTFTSKGRVYRCITPKPCSNFYVEDMGVEPIHLLTIDCTTPAEKHIGQTAEICLNVHNGGNCTESNILVTLPITDGVRLATNNGNGTLENGCITWRLPSLEASNNSSFCTTIKLRQTGALSFAPGVSSSGTKPSVSSCSMFVVGIPAILLETSDLEDPVEVGKNVTYVIKVTNQGTAPGTHVKMVCTLPDSEEFVSCTGITVANVDGKTINMGIVDTLAPKEVAEWHVIVKALKNDDARFNVALSSDQFGNPIHKEESTHLY